MASEHPGQLQLKAYFKGFEDPLVGYIGFKGFEDPLVGIEKLGREQYGATALRTEADVVEFQLRGSEIVPRVTFESAADKVFPANEQACEVRFQLESKDAPVELYGTIG